MVPKDQRAKILNELREFNSNNTLLPLEVQMSLLSTMPGPSAQTIANTKKWITWIVDWISNLGMPLNNFAIPKY